MVCSSESIYFEVVIGIEVLCLRMDREWHAPGYPGLGPRFGVIRGVWYLQGGDEVVAIVEEGLDHGHWWMMYHWVGDGWINFGAFVSVGHLIAQTPPLFAVVIDVADPVDPMLALELVVEDSPEVRCWIIYWVSDLGRVPFVMFSAPRCAFVVPI